MNGILFGLGAASFQSLSYLLSRAFFSRHGHSPWLLLVVSHTLMGVMALVLLPWVYPANMEWNRNVILGTLGAGGFYLLGQQALFMALRHIDASRLAPLLGAKILFLALVTVTFGGEWLSPQQWVAVVLAVGGVYVLNDAGGRPPLRGLLAVGVAVVGYSLSDLSIVRLVAGTGLDSLHGSLLGAVLTYSLCGLALAPFLYRLPAAAQPGTWRSALAYAVCWFCAMILLYACFAEIGAVFGNIIQSTRGLISIGLGLLLVRMGHLDIERKVDLRVTIKRGLGAVAMTLAIALYVLQG